MTAGIADAIDLRPPVCPLCHTLDHTVTADSLRAGASWVCVRCGAGWSAVRLQTVAEYAQHTAAR
jgi:transposase-like protein